MLMSKMLQTTVYTMFVQNLDMDMNPRAAKADSGLLSKPELEQMISWETNNLYEYLKELYDHKHDDMVDDRYVVRGILTASLCLCWDTTGTCTFPQCCWSLLKLTQPNLTTASTCF